jgi:hypothetical protein
LKDETKKPKPREVGRKDEVDGFTFNMDHAKSQISLKRQPTLGDCYLPSLCFIHPQPRNFAPKKNTPRNNRQFTTTSSKAVATYGEQHVIRHATYFWDHD